MLPRKLKNRLALVKSYLLKRERLNAFPFEIAIGITNRCNLDCSFCPHRDTTRRRGDISLDLLDSLVRQVSPYADVIDLSFDGEPFLHPRWEECIGICHQHKVRAILQTNGLLMDNALAASVMRSRVDAIIFSVDAATEETYRRLKPGGDYKKLIANVENFLRVAGGVSRRPKITIQFVRGPENRHEVSAFLNQWKGKGADSLRIKPMLNFGGSVDSGFTGKQTKPCILLWTSLSIHWDGIVTLCCMDIEGRTRMGDASKEKLKDIVDNESFRKVRRLHLEGKYDQHAICRSCDVPPIAWYLILGSAFIDDMTRRELIRFAQRFGFLQNR